MAKSPITVVWASTTSNKETLDTTRQGNGIVFESDIVSNFVNSALYINSQATRNLQVMGGYYDAGQEYKNYQFCSQIEFVGGEYVLNYYMATQDKPTLAPTDATSYQQGTTDMEIPTNGSNVQSGWKQLKLLPNQDNIAYKDKENHFTQDNMFDSLGDSTLKSNSTLDCQNGKIQLNGFYISNTDDSSGNIRLFYSQGAYTKDLNIDAQGSDVTLYIGDSRGIYGAINNKWIASKNKVGTTNQTTQISATSGLYVKREESQTFYPYYLTAKIYDAELTLEDSRDYYNQNQAQIRGCKISLKPNNFTYPPTSVAQPYATLAFEASSNRTTYNTIWFKTKTNHSQAMEFQSNCTIVNAQFGSITRGLDPVWEQDYATANYVNQKLQELFDYLDTRLTTIENKLGITSAKSRAKTIDAKAMINNIAVPKSKVAELFDRLENLQGYERVLGYSNAEERMELSKAIDNEEIIMQIMDSIKARMEAEAKERELQEAQQNQNLSKE